MPLPLIPVIKREGFRRYVWNRIVFYNLLIMARIKLHTIEHSQVNKINFEKQNVVKPCLLIHGYKQLNIDIYICTLSKENIEYNHKLM